MALNISDVCDCSRTDANDLALTIFNASSNSRFTHWVNQPLLRGTWNILWTCLITVFICTYILTVPEPHDSLPVLVRRRILWMFLAFVAPEIVLTYASGQWIKARQSV